MKKLMLLILTATMLMCTSCAEKSDKNTSSLSSHTNHSESEMINNPQQKNNITESEERSHEEIFYNFNGLNMRQPDNLKNFREFDYSGKYLGGFYSCGRDYRAKEKLQYNIVIDCMNYADYYASDCYGLDDVWEILNESLYKNINNIYSVCELGDAEIATTEKVDFLGTEFIRSTGSIPMITNSNDELDLYYAAYYGILDFPANDSFPEFKSVPIMWIAWSNRGTYSIRTEMEKIVDTVAENASWISEE